MPPKSNHDGIKELSEQEAALLFESPAVKEAADRVATHFRDADLKSGRSDALRREAAREWLQSETTTQAEGGRLANVRGKRAYAEAMLAAAQSEADTVAGEEAWADLAARYGLYIPHGRRLECRVPGKPGWVYCFDVDEGEMGMHEADACPSGALRHSRHVAMLRRRGAGGKLAPWPGRKDV